MRWQKPSIQRCNCARGWETRRIPPGLHAKVTSRLINEWSRLRAGTRTCYEGLSDGPLKLGVARPEQLVVNRHDKLQVHQHWCVLGWAAWAVMPAT